MKMKWECISKDLKTLQWGAASGSQRPWWWVLPKLLYDQALVATSYGRRHKLTFHSEEMNDFLPFHSAHLLAPALQHWQHGACESQISTTVSKLGESSAEVGPFQDKVSDLIRNF